MSSWKFERSNGVKGHVVSSLDLDSLFNSRCMSTILGNVVEEGLVLATAIAMVEMLFWWTRDGRDLETLGC